MGELWWTGKRVKAAFSFRIEQKYGRKVPSHPFTPRAKNYNMFSPFWFIVNWLV